MGDRKQRKIFFESIKEARDGYFVEYGPPGGEARFAWLTLVFHQEVSSAVAKKKMEAEAQSWTKRYAVPVMVFASDEKGDTVELSDSWKNNNLIAWKRQDGQLEQHWELLEDEALPADALSLDYLLQVYDDVPYRTGKEVREQADRNSEKRRKELRVGFAIIFLWAVAIPASVAIIGWANPVIGLIVTLYAFGKAARQGGLLLGWIKPSSLEKKNREKERRMRHYYYHCERNPDGFRRIVSENFEQDERARIQAEAKELTSASSRPDKS